MRHCDVVVARGWILWSLGLLLVVNGGCGDDDAVGGQDAGPDSSTFLCGDGVVEGLEECDDGEQNSDLAADACRTDCRDPYCGDGAVDTGETCDDGAQNSDVVPDACRTNCQEPTCGDGVVDVASGETCDDGNTDAGDGCGGTCRVEFCGNEVLDPGEVCDDGNFVGGDGCSPDCLSDETCGNGYVDWMAGEQCDEGPANSDAPNAACRTDCHPGRCGDGILDDARGELCEVGVPGAMTCADFGFYTGTLSCDPSCSYDTSGCLEYCGDGIVQGTELCDGAPPSGLDCTDFGYSGGSLGCTTFCSPDLSGCS